MNDEENEVNPDDDIENDVNPDVDSEDELTETVVMSDAESTDNVGDVSVEINVEQLIADIESEESEDASRKQKMRRKLEDMAEERSFEDTYAIEFDS